MIDNSSQLESIEQRIVSGRNVLTIQEQETIRLAILKKDLEAQIRDVLEKKSNADLELKETTENLNVLSKKVELADIKLKGVQEKELESQNKATQRLLELENAEKVHLDKEQEIERLQAILDVKIKDLEVKEVNYSSLKENLDSRIKRLNDFIKTI